ncbi:MAG: hypothetical protein ACKPKO_52695, partial [Candidatus Fonsibacter sp.]
HSASLRLGQNLDLWHGLDVAGRARFDGMFYRWKAVGQVLPGRAVSLTKRKVPAAAVLRFVYRTGTDAAFDWSTQLRAALDGGTRGQFVPQLPFAAKLKVDFLRHVLTSRQVFSLPSLPDADALAALENVTLEHADAALHEAAKKRALPAGCGDERSSPKNAAH